MVHYQRDYNMFCDGIELLIQMEEEAAKVEIVKNERDPALFTGKLLIKFENILRNTTQVIVRHRICLQTDGHGETF
jgi:hypothetical protein